MPVPHHRARSRRGRGGRTPWTRGRTARALATATAAAALAGLTACGTAGEAGEDTGNASGEDAFTIGLLLPDVHTARWATADKPLIQAKVKALCPDCKLLHAYASADVATQQQQIESMIAKGAKVLILDPVDDKALRSSIARARDANVPVVSYDRLAQGPISAYSSYDSEEIGRIQAQELLKAMGPKARGGQIVMMNGDPTDPNTRDLRRGALSVLEGKVKIARSYYTGGWIPENAFRNMSAAIAELGPDRIDGVLSANDGLAGGVVTALKAAGVKPLPPVTGQDADLSAIRRIVKGEQYMTVYKSFEAEAEAAAEMAVALGRGEKLDDIAKDRVRNDTDEGIPAVLGPLVPVTRGNVEETVVENGLYTVDQICTPAMEAACRNAGLTG
ncbi:substrate-binding domain-containing protein [Streptomyces chengbuensis]|uniref:sugar ABC transporter substrate-binding protein n=1 Tax=Streptomyces chengbuensis TaxID=3053466 RepID=UPI0025B500C1|nr:substrate-binding domain-containing protein [Streptomyces sp. HUAS CB01]WJY54243.1 substrate-binding domain-containing protein [Streptomyces sp. HUAS CB01]